MSNKLQLSGSKPDRKELTRRATLLSTGMRNGKHVEAVLGVVVDRVGRLVRGKGGVRISEIHGAVAHRLGTTPYRSTI